MMSIRILLIFSLFCSCSNPDETGIPMETALDSARDVIPDTGVPSWLIARYPANVPRSFDTVRQQIVKFNKRPGGLSYCIYEQADGNCLKRFLSVFEGHFIRDSVEMDLDCDHDASYPTSNWKESRQINDTCFYVISYSKKIPDKYIASDGHLKDGHDFIELEDEAHTDSSRLEICVGPDRTHINRITE